MGEVTGPEPQDARSIPRIQGRRLAAGGGRYVADIEVESALHAVFVRSPYASARVLGVDDLRKMGAGNLKVGWVTPGQRLSEFPLLADGVARYVGDPVAVVVAESPARAEDAAELVLVDYEPHPAVVDVIAALDPGATLVYAEWGDNVLARTVVEGGDPDGAIRRAHIVLRERFHIGRSSAMPLEPKGAIATYDPFTDEITLVSSTQSPHHARADIAECLGRPEGSVRVIAPDVGGSFGAKDHASAVETILCLLASRLRRPVRWIEERTEHVATSGHSRGQVCDVELGADADGRILALRGRLLLDVGAYPSTHGIGTALYSAAVLPGVYRFGDYRMEVVGVVTNEAPTGAYRGYGAPEAAFVIESLVDALARRLGLDPVELRRRNILTPDAFPYRTASGCSYDRADLPRVLDLAIETADYSGFRSSNPAGRTAQGEVLEGIGVACVVLMGGFGCSSDALAAGMRYGGFESANVRMDADGKVVLATGLPTQGQGIDTALAQICAARLGIDAEHDVRIIAGDTAVTPFSPVGPVGSRGAAVGGGAVDRASAVVADTIRRAAGVLLEASPEDVELSEGRACVRGAPGKSLAIGDVAAEVKRGRFVGEGVDPGLEATADFDPPDLTYSFGVHVARVRVDVATGEVRVLSYVTASDCGTLINPAIVRGQIEGGVVQGIGGALLEEIVYGSDGELLTGSLLDYSVPSALEVPSVETVLIETPTPRNPTGARGAGEIGIIGPAAAIANALADALGPDAPAPRRVPLGTERVRLLANTVRSEA